MSNRHAGFFDRHYFLLRRLHSLSGIFPIGAFLLVHLTTNASIVWGDWLNPAHHGHAGVETFQHEVDFIYNLPALVLMEWGLLFFPIIFHSVLGMYFAFSGRTNVDRYPYQNNWRYTLQRLSGYLGVVFIIMHITSLRFDVTYWNLMPAFDGDAASSSTAAHFQNGAWGWFASLFYLVCVLALVFHFANGLWTAAITWGLTLSVQAQRRWGVVCAALGVALGAATVMAVIGFSTLDIDQARDVEQAIKGASADRQLVDGDSDQR